MSGGSFNYLYCKSIDKLLWTEDLKRMADALAELGYAQDAAKATHQVILSIRRAQAEIEAGVEALSGVWKAVEWWVSCDWGEDSVKEALAEYRGENGSERPEE